MQKLEVAREPFANCEDRLANGEVDIRDLVVSKRITREPRDYQKAGITAIAAQQLFGSGVKLRPGQNIEYVITNSEAHVPNDRVRAYALWEGWYGYDRRKYAAMLREAFEPASMGKIQGTLRIPRLIDHRKCKLVITRQAQLALRRMLRCTIEDASSRLSSNHP